MRWRGKEKGASLVEVGLVLPMLLVLGLGLSEVGFLVVDYITAANAARSGARTGAAAADNANADDAILEVVEEDACNLRYGDLVKVTVFEADPVDGSMPDPVSSKLVNTYVPSGALQCDATGHALVCAGPPLSCDWDPTTDRDNVPPGFDAIGVEVEFSHTSVTKLFSYFTGTWSDTAVMQLEPDTRA